MMNAPSVNPDSAALQNAASTARSGGVYQTVPINEIRFEPLLYVFGQGQEALIPKNADGAYVKAMSESHSNMALADNRNVPLEQLPMPLVVVRRDGKYPNNKYVLVWDLPLYLTASYQSKIYPSVQAIVYPELPDHEILKLGLNIRADMTPPTIDEVVYQFARLAHEESLHPGEYAPINWGDLVKRLAHSSGNTVGYINKLRRTAELFANNRHFLNRELPPKIAISAAQSLRGAPENVIEDAIDHVIERQLDSKTAIEYVRQVGLDAIPEKAKRDVKLAPAPRIVDADTGEEVDEETEEDASTTVGRPAKDNPRRTVALIDDLIVEIAELNKLSVPDSDEFVNQLQFMRKFVVESYNL